MNKQKSILLFVICIMMFAVSGVSADFTDDFSDENYAANGWNSELLFGKPELEYIYPGNNMLTFRYPDYNTAINMINQNTMAEDSAVEVSFENVYSNHGEFGVICRSNEKGWYELRVYLSGFEAGSYAVYRYDKELKNEKKNPYVCLHPLQDRIYTKSLKTGINAKNTLKMLCEGDEIRIFINGNEMHPIQYSRLYAREYQSGLSGFSVWTSRPYGYAEINVTGFRTLLGNE